MLLIEADGKALLRAAGIATPDGVNVSRADEPLTLPGSGPWMVKAQVPAGGRGKAGGIVRCGDEAAVRAALARLFGIRIKGHTVQSCLIETAVSGRDEYYLSLMIDPAHQGVRATLLREGGVDVEQATNAMERSRLAAPDPAAIAAAVRDLAATESPGRRAALAETSERLAGMFMRHELMLAEINPLFIDQTGCVAGDAKIVLDLGAMHRQPELLGIVERNAAIYPDAIRKLRDGFDYVEVDPEGEIGLLTTGAGLSMMMIDELTARGGRPLNFCDIRTGQLRGDPARLIKVLEWIAARPSARVLMVGVFAGITDLSEFATLFCDALERTPQLKMPIVARLIGNRLPEAREILAARRPDIIVEEELDRALARVDAILQGGRTETRTEPAVPAARPSGDGVGPAGARQHADPHPRRPGRTVIGRLSRSTPVLVQGATGRAGSVHVRRMMDYGTNIVAGVSARAAGSRVEGVPIFADCHAAVAATGARVSVVMVPPHGVLAAVEDALSAGIELVVTVAEGVPVHDALRIGRMVKESGAAWVGASTPGLAVPGEVKLGFLPDVSLRPGPLGMISKSGTLSYETGYRLVQAGLGQSIWVGVGGDAVKGLRFADLIDTFNDDERTQGIVLIGEVGGNEEEEFAGALMRSPVRKPVYALIAGRGAKEGVAMGHAGALTFGDVGTFESKRRRLEAAGVRVFSTIDGLIAACRDDFASR